MHDELLETLPAKLDVPRYFLSRAQAEVIRARLPALLDLVDALPGWVPHQRIAQALGFSSEGIERALELTHGRPYVWATEFENVHSLWRFEEPQLRMDGRSYDCVEAFYHAQKPRPFDAGLWDTRRVEVMRRGLAAKFAKVELRALLDSTAPHPLVSIKPDRFWGVDASRGGVNMLGHLLEELRDGGSSRC